MSAVVATKRLGEDFAGRVVAPEDDDYDTERLVWNGLHDRRPVLVAQCTGVADVVAAVRAAREQGLPISVRSGGHGHDGFAVADDALLVDLGPMTGVAVNASRRRATVQSGSRWVHVDRELQLHGLAIAGGTVPHVGVGGFTLGGGIGWMARKHGTTCSNVVSVEAVTASGELVRASEQENSDLFWALRGGCGNFAIATAFEFEAHPLSTRTASGSVVHVGGEPAAALRFWRDFMHDAPEEITSVAAILHVPAFPPFPPELHGRLLVSYQVFHAGALEQAERDLEPLRRWGSPASVDFGPRSYVDFKRAAEQGFSQIRIPSAARWYSTTGYPDAITDDLIDVAVAEFEAAPAGAPGTPELPLLNAPMLTFWRLGGAMARTPRESMAFTTDAPYIFQSLVNWGPPSDDELWIAWERQLRAKLDGFSSRPERYLNFMTDTSDELVRDQYGEKYGRLAEIKARWDPENVLCSTKNIPPAVG